MKKTSQLDRLRTKFGDAEFWDSGSKHAERDLGFISSAGVFDENGAMLSEPWSDAQLFAPVVDEAVVAKRQMMAENRKKEQSQRDRAVYEALISTKSSHVHLSRMNLTTIPQDFFSNITLRNVRVLSLAENSLADLPTDLFNMVWLTQLKLMHNKLTTIPEDIGKLKELRILWIQHNSLCLLPKALVRCLYLSALDFSSNEAISYLPLNYASMTNLTLLNANNCAINTPPPFVMAKSVKKIQEYLQRLIFAQNSDTLRHTDIHIVDIPELIFEWLPNLTSIDLSNCGLQLVQDAFFSSLSLLVSMDLSHNLLSEISPRIGLLSQLTFLDISANLITLLPANIGFLPLQTFNYLQKGMVLDPIGPSEFESKSRNTKQFTVSEWRKKRSVAQEQNANDSNIYDLYGDLTRAPLNVFLCFLRELELCRTTGTIDFGCMFLQRVPEALLHQDLVEQIILRQNQLIMIPQAIGQLMPLLKKLDLAENALCDLPDSLSKLSNIEYLDISKNCFNNLGHWLSACTSLTHLNIEDNNIDSIPKSYRALQKMQVFLAQNNKVSRLPRFIGGWPDIGGISVWNPILIDPPPEISTRTDSETHQVDCARYMRAVFLSKHAGFARLSGFGLLGLPNRFVASSKSLKVLDLGENSIRCFPVWISILTCLEAFNISFNLISELPDSIQCLTSLRSLNLNNNPIGWLPSCLVAITCLREVSVTNCDMLRCPSAFVCSRGWLADNGMRSFMLQLWQCRESLEVDLSGFGLFELDLSPYCLTSITELHLDDNKIESLPMTIANMFSLSRLHASNNSFQKWPLCGRMWQNIVLLNLSLNAIDSVPKDIQCMTSLEKLMLTGNKLTFIAPHIGRCLKLTHISLRDNPNLQTIPLEFGRCSNIQALSMSPSLLIPQFCVCSTRGGALFQPYMASALLARSSKSLHLERLDIETFTHELFSYSYSTQSFFHDALNEVTLLHLNLSHNKIVFVPDEISLFLNLKILNFGYNQICKISSHLQSLSQLSDLNVQNNSIQAFSAEMFKNWTQLVSLNFSSNRLSRFPDFLFTCCSLQVFVSFGNPWIFPNVNLGNRLGNNIVALIFASQIGKIIHSQFKDQQRLEHAHELQKGEYLKMQRSLRSNRPESAPQFRFHSKEAETPAVTKQVRPISSDSKSHLAQLRQNQEMIDSGVSATNEYQICDSLQETNISTPRSESADPNSHQLELIGYGVEDFPMELCLLTSLQVLNLRNNILTELPNKFTQLSQLHYINFSQNRFKAFPSILVQLHHLVGLDLSSNFLPEWPSELFQLSQLVSLNLSRNFMTRIPDRIALFTQLRTFLIHGNQLNYVPRTFYFLSNLTALNLSSNPMLQLIPCELGILKGLRFFFIDNNTALYSPPTELHGTTGTSNALANRYLFQLYKSRICMKLDLTNFDLVEIPCCPFKPFVMLFLLEVNLSNNKIRKLSPSLVLLARLQNLNMSSNMIEGVDSFLTSLSSLRSFDLSFNNIRHCGAAFMMWKLQDICLTGNSALTCLTCISDDDVSSDCICNQSGLSRSAWCTSLKELRCNETSVSHLPRSLSRSKDLSVLNFENTLLQCLHSDILQCKFLKVLRWSGCPHMDSNLVLLLSQGVQCVQTLSRRLDAAFQTGILNLQGILLEDIPFVAQELDIWSDALHSIKASGLPRQHLPSWLPNLRILSSISVEKCGLSKLSEEIFNCKMLRELFASHNQITAVYIEESMKMLEILNLSHNRISVLNLCENACPLLSVLLIHHNFLLTLPENLKYSSCLRYIDCSFCLIRQWPPSLHALHNAEYIDISHNSLHSFTISLNESDKFRIEKDPNFLSNLTSLNISYNSFSAVPDWVDKCHALCEFRTTCCRCTTIPWKLGMRMNIKVIEYDQDKVTDPPSAFSQYGLHGIKLYGVKLETSSKRRVLVFDNMAFRTLPASMFSVHNLLKLSLKHCNIPTMPSDIVNLSAILSLTFSNCHLSESPAHIENLTTLLLLDLGSNDALRDLDNGISKLKRLQNLNISHCAFDTLPRCVLSLSTLTILDVSHNSVSRIPSRIGRLTQLVRLHVAYNNISSLPPSIGCCSFMRILDIQHNPINWLPWQMGQLGALMRLSTSGLILQPPLNQLVASGGVEKLKAFFYNALIGVETGSGNFARLHISSLSASAALIGVGLKTLDLSMNNIHMLPSDCGLWTDLKRLDLSRNNLAALHANFQNFVQLKYLRLNHNKLFAFPDVTLNLTNLKVLNLSKNRIHSIPGTVSCMYFLRELNLNDNVITELPEELRFCTSLLQLMLVRNRIQFIPSSLSVMKNLLIEIFDGYFCALPISEEIRNSLQQKFQDEEIVATFNVYAQTITHALIPANKIPLNETFMCELYFVTRLQNSDEQFTSGLYYFSSNMQIQEDIASFKVSSALFEQFMLNGLSLLIHVWIKTKTESKLICFREIKLLPSMCSGVPFVLNMNETVSVNEPGSFMTTFGVVTQNIDASTGAINEESNEVVSQLVQDSLNLLLPEWSNLDFSDVQMSHLLEIDSETYQNEKFTVKQCLSSSVANRRLQINGTVVWTLPDPLCSGKLFESLEGLEMCFCSIKTLPSAISYLVNLKIMNLSSNQLNHISQDAFPILKLEIVELQRNFISEIPESLGSCCNIKSIDISSNVLHSLPLSLGKCIFLETLNFAENPMSCLPNAIFSKEIADLKSFLHSLSLQFSKCHVSFQDFGLSMLRIMPNLSWESLRELNLSKNSLVSISERIFSSLNTLQIINISENPITVFPAIWNCLFLSQAILHHTHIRDIPSNVSKLHCLEYLDLSWCHLCEITEHMADVPILKKICLSGNKFDSPVTLNLPISCVSIELFGACLSSLKFQSEAKRSRQETTKQDMVRRFGKTLLQRTQQSTRVIQGHIYRDEHLSSVELSRANQAKVDNLRIKLGLSRHSPSKNDSSESHSTSSSHAAASNIPKQKGLTGNRIDEMVSSSTHTVKVMNLADNNFQTFATNLAHYHPVEELDMKNNRISELVICLEWRMHDCLQYFDLSHNLISVFPSQLLKFPKLKTLLIDHNRISSFAQIPATDGRAPSSSLRTLSFHHNQVDLLPDTFCHLCSGLTELWMHGNVLINLPLDMSMLIDLQTLTLSSNRLRQLPDVFNHLVSLNELWIQQNPLVNVPQSLRLRKIPIFLHNLAGGVLQ